MGLFDFFTGSKPKMKNFNDDSLESLLSLLRGGGLQGNQTYDAGNDFIQNLLSGNPEAFKNFEAPFMQNFEQNIVPGIAERFAGMGTGAGALSSSGLYNSLAQAGRGLQTDLAGLRSGLQMQALPQALQYSQQPISNQLNAASQIPGQYYEKGGQPGLFQGAAGGAGYGAGQKFAGGGNPMSQLMSFLKNLSFGGI